MQFSHERRSYRQIDLKSSSESGIGFVGCNVTEEDWHQFIFSGEPAVRSVGRLSSDLCRHLGAATNLVLYHHSYALKAQQKHRLEARHFPMLTITIDIGRAISDHKGHITFYFQDVVMFGTWFKVTVKYIESKNELWVATFHKVRPTEVTRRCSKHALIRPEKW